MHENDNAKAVVDCYRELLAAGLGGGASGNVSLRAKGGMLITPTGVRASDLREEHIVEMSLSGDRQDKQLLPSSEWQLHAAIYRDRSDVHAVVHCHSRYATILACARRAVPALHYMIAVTGSNEIPVAPYATFGSDELAHSTVTTLRNRQACLLANHGQISLGASLGQALGIATEVEELSAIYWGSLAIGGGHCLSEQEMDVVQLAFGSYGQQEGAET